MRFKRHTRPREIGVSVTPRKLAHAARVLQKNRDSFSLFPELADQRTPEERLIDNDRAGVRWMQGMRDKEAANWRRARRLLRGLRPMQRAGLVRWWQAGVVPGVASYLLSAIHDATKKRQCFWHSLAQTRRFKLIGEGRLANPWIKKSPVAVVAAEQSTETT